METAVIYCDGSCSTNNKNGGYAAYIIKEKSILVSKGNEKNTTNSRMEIQAAISGIGELDAPHFIFLVSDSAYVINSIKKQWYKNWTENKKNWDLWEILIQLIEYHIVIPIWVKGHSKVKYNDLVDRYAKEERLKLC